MENSKSYNPIMRAYHALVTDIDNIGAEAAIEEAVGYLGEALDKQYPIMGYDEMENAFLNNWMHDLKETLKDDIGADLSIVAEEARGTAENEKTFANGSSSKEAVDMHNHNAHAWEVYANTIEDFKSHISKAIDGYMIPVITFDKDGDNNV